MGQISREVAWRVFAAEYNAARESEQGEGERAPNYQISPLGARINRLYLVGVLTNVENAGTEAEPLWRARVSDPTGVFYLSAGQYDPGAAKALSTMEPPMFVAVIGKARSYSPEEGTVLLSVRPEVVREVTERERDHWVLETCRSTLLRLDAMEEAGKLGEPGREKLVSLGYKPILARGVVDALNLYGPQELERFREIVLETLGSLAGQDVPGPGMEFPRDPFPRGSAGRSGGREPGRAPGESGISDPDPPEDVTPVEGGGPGPQHAQDRDEGGVSQRASGARGAQAPSPADAVKGELVALIAELDNDEKGAPYNDIITESKKRKMDREAVDEAINTMLMEGDICEPVLGRIRRVD